MTTVPVPRRGDVWWTDFGEPVGREQGHRRPAVVLSADGFNAQPLGLAVVIPVTSTRRGWRTHVAIPSGVSGLREESWAKCEDLKSVSQLRLTRQVGSVSTSVLTQIEEIARRILDL